MIATVEQERAAVVTEARTWLRTPYHNLARIKGVGVDCAQLLIAVYCALELTEEPDVGNYSPEWHLHHSEEQYLGWMEKYCRRVYAPLPGDIAMFRYGRCVSHGGIITRAESGSAPWMVHSYITTGVIEEELLTTGALFPRLDSFWSLNRWAP